MASNGILRLCGGTVFTLILETRQQRYGVREHFKGDSDGLSEMDTLIGLAQVMVPDLKRPAKAREDTVQGNTTEFKICKTAGGRAYYPFSNRQSKKAFDDRVRTDYNAALEDMKGFVASFLAIKSKDKKDINLIRALLDLIEQDGSIPDKQLFYIQRSGKPLTRAQINKLDNVKVCFEAFLLGVWHYALLRKEGNCIGAATMNEWCPSRGGAPRDYEGTMGDNLMRNVELTYLTDNEADATVEGSFQEDDESDDISEPEIVDSIPEPEEIVLI